MLDVRKILKKPFGFIKESFGDVRALNLRQAERLLLVCGTVIIVALCVVLPLTLQTQVPIAFEEGFSSSSSINPQTQPKDEDNDILAVALSSGEYVGTVLDETADAGVDYVKETLFIGDSNTAGMLNHSATTNVTMDNGIGIVSMGISHVTTLNCVKFRGMAAVPVPEAVKIMQPRRIVITYGTNDYHMNPEKFAEAYKKALDAIVAAYPYSDIIIGSIFPITSTCSYYTVTMPIVEKFNLELVKVAQEKGVKFLNWSEPLKDPASGFCKPEYMAGDGVHLSKKGHEEIFAYFRTHKFDSEDRRPKPLEPIPVREPTPFGLLGVGLPTSTDKPEPQAGQGLVSVTFSAGAGGTLLKGGASGKSFTVKVAPGAVAGPVTAQAEAGYVFKGWSGAASSGGTSISFTVPADAEPGAVFSLTAVFEAESITPPSDDPPVDPPPVDPPPVDPPPVDPPPVDPPPVDPPPVDPPPVDPPDDPPEED